MLSILNRVYRFCVNFSGSVFVIFSIISILLVLGEMIHYQVRKHRVKKIPLDEIQKNLERMSEQAEEESAEESWNMQAEEFSEPVSRKPRSIIIITGASSGLGREFALQLDRSRKPFNEFWLIARRRDRLEELAGKLKHPSRVLPLDLTDPESIQIFKEALDDRDNPVHVHSLINCAGLGRIGNYRQLEDADNDGMIELNDRAAVDVTNAALPYLSAGSRIIEICSTAAFQPLQHFNIYASSKIFLYYYSRALRMELLPRGISVTAVCPYWVKNTEFIPTAGKSGSKAIRSFPLAGRSRAVVRRAIRAASMNLAVSTPGIVCFLHRIFAHLIPREGMLWIWEGLRRI